MAHKSSRQRYARSFAEALQLLRRRRFGAYCIANLLSNIGGWAQQIAQPWLLLTLGASPFLIGLDSFAAAAPVLLLALMGGVLADRGDRRRIVVTCQSIQLLCPLLLVVLLLTGAVSPWMVIASSAIIGITDALSMPAFQAIIPSLVERRQIAAAVTLNTAQFNLSRVVGPAFASILMSTIGVVGCFALNAASFVPFLWVACKFLPRGRADARPAQIGERRSFPDELAALMADRMRRNALLTVLLTSGLCGPLIVFCPVLVKTALHEDVGHFSLAIAAFGIGGLLGAIGLLGVDSEHTTWRLTAVAAVLYGATVALVAITPWAWTLSILFALAGLAMAVTNTSANSRLQLASAEHVRGEVASLYMLAMRGGLSIGCLITGAMAQTVGIRGAFLINGLLAVLCQCLVARSSWTRDVQPQGSRP